MFAGSAPLPFLKVGREQDGAFGSGKVSGVDNSECAAGERILAFGLSVMSFESSIRQIFDHDGMAVFGEDFLSLCGLGLHENHAVQRVF